MSDIKVFYTSFNAENMAAICNEWLSFLSPKWREINQAYKKPEDRTRNLLGKLLLNKFLEREYGNLFSIDDIVPLEYGKPFISKDFDFNISHSGNYVCCAFAKNNTIGIDIEEIKPLDFEDFTNMMSPREWIDIKTNENPERKFYNYWSKKEALIKAYGLGFFAPLERIIVEGDVLSLDGKKWYAQELYIDKNYSTHAISPFPNSKIEIEEIRFI